MATQIETDGETDRGAGRTLEGDVRRARAELQSTIGELRGVMGESLDWRAWVRRHPWPTLALVAAIGLRLGRGRWL